MYTILGWSLEWVNDLLRAVFFTPIYPIYPYNKCSFKFQSPLIAECSHQPPPDRPARQMRPTRRWEQLKHENLEWKCRNLQISAVEKVEQKEGNKPANISCMDKVAIPHRHCHCWKEIGQWFLVAIHWLLYIAQMVWNLLLSNSGQLWCTEATSKFYLPSIHPSIYPSIVYSIWADLRTLVIAMPEGRFAQALPIPQLPAMKSSDVLHTNLLVVNHRSSCEDEECEPISIRSFINQRVYLGIFLWAK